MKVDFDMDLIAAHRQGLLSARCVNALAQEFGEQASLRTISKLNERELARLPNIGPRSVLEIEMLFGRDVPPTPRKSRDLRQQWVTDVFHTRKRAKNAKTSSRLHKEKECKLETSPAQRQRRQRERRKAGRVIMKAEIDECKFAEALILANRLSAEETGNRKLVEAELQKLAEDFIERWTRNA